MLEETSRTFYIPISRLPGGLQQAVGSAYLCLRAIDEIEDHAACPERSRRGCCGISAGSSSRRVNGCGLRTCCSARQNSGRYWRKSP